MTAELPLLPAPPQPAGLLPAPAAPVALLPARIPEPAQIMLTVVPEPLPVYVRKIARKRDAGDLIKAKLLNQGIEVSKVMKHQGANKGLFSVSKYRVIPYTREEAIAVAQQLRDQLLLLGFKVINWGVDIVNSLSFNGQRTAIVTFALNETPTPTQVIEPWAKRAVGMPVLRIA